MGECSERSPERADAIEAIAMYRRRVALYQRGHLEQHSTDRFGLTPDNCPICARLKFELSEEKRDA